MKEKIGIIQATDKGYVECELGGAADFSYPNSTTRRGRVEDMGQICPTLLGSTGVCIVEKEERDNIARRYRIRRLTPRECGRLMDVSDADIDRMSAVQSKTQLYKEFGNSIVVNVLVALFGQLFIGTDDIYRNANRNV